MPYIQDCGFFFFLDPALSVGALFGEPVRLFFAPGLRFLEAGFFLLEVLSEFAPVPRRLLFLPGTDCNSPPFPDDFFFLDWFDFGAG